MLISVVVLAAALLVAAPDGVDPELLTVAEASDYDATATYDDVIGLLDRIAARSDVLRRIPLGTTVEGREIPLVILSDPPVDTPEAARALGRPIVLTFANIHAGEVCGKEATLMLIREIALTPDHPLLDEVVMVFAPIYNADGNDRFAPDNRPGQVGPREMGQRPNAQGLDLNRDYVKLESPEARALVRFFTEWDPQVTIDCHTTNGSYHRYTLTYDVPLNPSGAAEPIAYLREQLIPAVTEDLRERTGYDTFYYGNLGRDQATWTTYSAEPRFGGPYQGLRGQMAVLSEAYSYATYEDRVLCTREFVRGILEYVGRHGEEIRAIHDRARTTTTEAGRNPQPDDIVGIRHRPAAHPRPAIIKGYVMAERPAVRPAPTEEPRDYTVVHRGRFEATRSVPRPFAYLISAGHDAIVEQLHRHGIVTEAYRGGARVERYEIDAIDRAPREFQGHRIVRVEATATVADVDAATWTMVRTAQPLGTLAVYLLEPESADGLVAWNFFDADLEVGASFPVLRVRSEIDLTGP